MSDKRLVWVGVGDKLAMTQSDREDDEDSVVMEPTDRELDELAVRLEKEHRSVLRRMKREVDEARGDVLDGAVVDLCDEREEGGGEGASGEAEYEQDEYEVVMDGLTEAKALVKEISGEKPTPEMKRLRKVVLRTRRRYRALMEGMREGVRGRMTSSTESFATVQEVRREVGVQVENWADEVDDEVEQDLGGEEGEDEWEDQGPGAGAVARGRQSAFGSIVLYGLVRGTELVEVAEAILRMVPEAKRLKVEEYMRSVTRLGIRLGCREEGRENVVVKMPHFVMEGLLARTRHIVIDGEKLDIRKFHEAPQCFNCWGYDHMDHQCVRERRCKKCAGFHHWRECRDPRRRCVNCVEAGVEALNTGHGAKDTWCPIFLEKSGQARWE